LLWCDQDAELSELYARADRIATDVQFAHFREVCEAEPERGKFGIDSAWVQRQRMIVDGLKWELSKRHPERLGDKTTLAGDKDNPVVVKVDREAIIAKLLEVETRDNSRDAGREKASGESERR
jgi:hypothetical protein